jgi:hypothetical protein
MDAPLQRWRPACLECPWARWPVKAAVAAFILTASGRPSSHDHPPPDSKGEFCSGRGVRPDGLCGAGAFAATVPRLSAQPATLSCHRRRRTVAWPNA